jgi:hypothetical protein
LKLTNQEDEMSVNVFAPINKVDATKEGIDLVTDAANAWGEAMDAFEWLAPFKGPGGSLLTLKQALAFEDDAAPWYVLLPDGRSFWCHPDAKIEATSGNMQSGPADWRGLLRESGCDSVLFWKARG